MKERVIRYHNRCLMEGRREERIERILLMMLKYREIIKRKENNEWRCDARNILWMYENFIFFLFIWCQWIWWIMLLLMLLLWLFKIFLQQACANKLQSTIDANQVDKRYTLDSIPNLTRRKFYSHFNHSQLLLVLHMWSGCDWLN